MFQTSGNKLCGNRFDQFCLNKCKILQVNADAGFAAKRTADKSQKQACFQGLPPENGVLSIEPNCFHIPLHTGRSHKFRSVP